MAVSRLHAAHPVPGCSAQHARAGVGPARGARVARRVAAVRRERVRGGRATAAGDEAAHYGHENCLKQK